MLLVALAEEGKMSVKNCVLHLKLFVRRNLYHLPSHCIGKSHVAIPNFQVVGKCNYPMCPGKEHKVFGS